MMRADSPLARREHVTLDDIRDVPVVVNLRSEVRRFYRQALGDGYEKLNVLASVDLNGNAAYFVKQGLAYGVTLEGAMAQYGEEKLCFRPFCPEIRQETYLVWKKYQPASRAVKAFIEHVTMFCPIKRHKKQAFYIAGA